MAKAWITDRWVKDATVDMPDGSQTKISPTPAQLKSIRSLPDHFRKARFGQGSRWSTRWLEVRPDGTKVERAKDFKLRRDAEALVAELEDDIRMGRYIDPSQQERPFSEIAEAWLQSKGKIKDATYRRYRRDLDNYVLPRWGTTPIGSIRREDVDKWVQELKAGNAPYRFADSVHVNVKKREAKPLSPASIEAIVGVAFASPIRYATSQGWLGRNPLTGLELPRDEKIDQELPTLKYEDVELLAAKALEASKRSGRRDDAVLVHLLGYTGPRIGEATALQVRDIDFAQARASINRTWTVDREGRRKLGPPKTWERRYIPLPSFLLDELKSLVEGKGPEDFVFTSSRGEPINDRNWYNRTWVSIRRDTNAEKLSVHDLRHVAATLSISAGADVKLVQQMLGHKDATETLNTYSHLWPSKIGEVISLVEARRNKALEKAA